VSIVSREVVCVERCEELNGFLRKSLGEFVMNRFPSYLKKYRI
jgi:hypothetical protein